MRGEQMPSERPPLKKHERDPQKWHPGTHVWLYGLMCLRGNRMDPPICAARRWSPPVSLSGMCCTQVVYSRVSRWDVLHPGSLFPCLSVGCVAPRWSLPAFLSGMCHTQAVYSHVSQWDVLHPGGLFRVSQYDVPHTGGLFLCLSVGCAVPRWSLPVSLSGGLSQSHK